MTPCSILIALDKFKGSLTAEEACAAAARGFRRAFPQAEIRALPIADGGEGTAAALRSALGGEWGTAPASDALGRPVESRFALIPNPAGGSLAVLEMSEASGLWRIGAGERDPRRATTFGTGQMLRAAAGSATEILIGIGGSATNDGGSGMAQALGFRFLDAAGEPIADLPAGLDRLARLDPPADLRLPPITVACDVDNPLLGEAGATRVYGPQKGVRPGDFGWFEARLARFADCAEALAGRPLRGVPGAGLANGLGFALIALCGARLRPDSRWSPRRSGCARRSPPPTWSSPARGGSTRRRSSMARARRESPGWRATRASAAPPYAARRRMGSGRGKASFSRRSARSSAGAYRWRKRWRLRRRIWLRRRSG
ncbi:MAG: glycerate kinase [Verrucomicrobiales bacterium]